MRFGAITREIFRDLISGTSRTLLFTLITTIVGGGLVVADTLTTLRIVEEARAFKQSGAAVVTVTSTGNVNGAACAAYPYPAR